MQVPAISDETASYPTMNAVIIYDKFDFAANANAMLERSANRKDATTHWSVKPWRVDMLDLPPAAEAALAEAAEAHLIVLAVRQVRSLLPWLLDWLERWAACRQIQGAALAIWEGDTADIRLAQALPELSQFARQHGLSLIYDHDSLAGEKSSIVASDSQKQEAPLIQTLPLVLEPRRPDYYRHWGLNE